MVDIPAPIPELPAPTPAGDLYSTYSPEGAAGGMFAPAYIKGFAPSEQAVADWRGTNRAIDSATVDALRMPMEWHGQEPETREHGPYGGGRIGTHLYFGDQRGTVDPAALRAASMGTPYDIGARRDAIAARLLQNQESQDLFSQAGGFRPGAPMLLPPLSPEEQAARDKYNKMQGISG